MKRTLKLFLLATVFIASVSAQARNPWRECGIGGMIFKDTGWAAVTSNIIWDLGSTATSSNVSSEDLCEGPTASVANLVHGSYAVVEEQTVVGEGEHLVAILDILGCEKTSHGQIIQAVRTDLSKDIASPAYESLSRLDKAKNYHSKLMNNVKTDFTSQCHLI